MATAVVMPKQGQSVESCIIVGWQKNIGDLVNEGDVLCQVETDKALLEVESPAAGTLLALFFAEGDDVLVLTNIAVVGQPDEEVESFRPSELDIDTDSEGNREGQPVPKTPSSSMVTPGAIVESIATDTKVGISPRAKRLAQQKGLDLAAVNLLGSGPAGRIIEQDVQAVLVTSPKMTPLAKLMVAQGDYEAPPRGSGLGGRVRSNDLTAAESPAYPPLADEVEIIPVKGVRQVIANRMLESLQTTAQLTLNASADARAMQAYRKRLKGSAEALGLQKVTINDLILFALSRILLQYPAMNALFTGDSITQHKNVHLGMAVDTPRGLMVPVIKQANQLNLKQISDEAKRVAQACQQGKVKPDEMSGGTFTMTNLGGFGIESFTPVLNPPQVGILGVGNINLKPVNVAGEVQFIPHLGLSLTINHQVVDGAPAARFLQALSHGLADLQLLLAL